MILDLFEKIDERLIRISHLFVHLKMIMFFHLHMNIFAHKIE